MSVPPRQLFSSLVDDAALFPPRSAGVASAVADHLTWQKSNKHDLVGPLVCPATRVEEVCTVLPLDDYLRLSIVVDEGADALARAVEVIRNDARLILDAVEARYADLGEEAAAVARVITRLRGVTAVLEVPRNGFEEVLPLIGIGPWHQAKYRTGGSTEDAFPTESELATFLLTCVAYGLPFKLTAGLHHVMRNYDKRTNFQQHGVLNVLVATDAALRDEPPEVVGSLLAQRDADILAARLRHWERDHCITVREAFRSFGCCEPAEPIGELMDLGLTEEWP